MKRYKENLIEKCAQLFEHIDLINKQDEGNFGMRRFLMKRLEKVNIE